MQFARSIIAKASCVCKVCACSAGYALEEPCNSFHHTACYSIAVFFNLRAKLQFISRTSVAQSTAVSACLMHSWPGTFRPVGKTDGRLGRHIGTAQHTLKAPCSPAGFTSESGEGHNNWTLHGAAKYLEKLLLLAPIYNVMLVDLNMEQPHFTLLFRIL